MALRMRHGDWDVLRDVAEYRAMTVSQVAALYSKGRKSVRRRLGRFVKAGLITCSRRGPGRSHGRPENISSLNLQGLNLLREQGLLDSSVPDDHVTAEKIIAHPDHDLLVNWFRIHLVKLAETLPRLNVRFLSPKSPFVARKDDGLPFVYDRVRLGTDDDKPTGFTPDGVIAITDSEEQKTLLFILEVDMDSEPLTSQRGKSSNVRDKILKYQAYFRQQGYKHYEEEWECSLRGFRLLFLTNTSARMAEICRLVQEITPSNFIWVADQERMFAQGLADAIWARGGNQNGSQESILGQGMCRASRIVINE